LAQKCLIIQKTLLRLSGFAGQAEDGGPCFAFQASQGKQRTEDRKLNVEVGMRKNERMQGARPMGEENAVRYQP